MKGADRMTDGQMADLMAALRRLEGDTLIEVGGVSCTAASLLLVVRDASMWRTQMAMADADG